MAIETTPPNRPNSPTAPNATGRTFYLPRLAPARYQRDAVVLWTMPIDRRRTGWLGDTFHSQFRELMLHTAARESLLCPVYVLMPDHIHLVWMGLRDDSDQRNGIAFLRRYLEPRLGAETRFQHQAHDHVLKSEERKRRTFAQTCSYVLMNPVRAGLAAAPQNWPFLGCIIPGYPDLHPAAPTYWPRFWQLYSKFKNPPL
jgi:putative transposase